MSEPEAVAALVENLRDQQRAGWLAGRRVLAETLAAGYPHLTADREAYLDLIYAEVCLRQELGESPGVDEYVQRFPAFADDLRALFEIHSVLDAPERGTEIPFGERQTETFPAAPLLGGDTVRRSPAARSEAAPRLPAARSPATTVITEGILPPSELGEYRLLGEVARGGMGVVYRAVHTRTGRIVALKVIAPTLVKSAASIRRFKREAHAAARLLHPNIVTTFDADSAKGFHYLVMEFVEGSDLARLVDEGGPFPPAAAVDYVLQAARGLENAHASHVIHRDIKPGNLLVDRRGVVKILDMGLARIDAALAAPEDDSHERLTETGSLLGTVEFMSPEQAWDTKNTDHRGDIYSLGCTLYFLLTGKGPFEGDTPVQKILAHREHPIPSLKEFCPERWAELDEILARMLAKRPEDRYQTMDRVIAALEAFLGMDAYGQGDDSSLRPAESVAAERIAASTRDAHPKTSFAGSGDATWVEPTAPATASTRAAIVDGRRAGFWTRATLALIALWIVILAFFAVQKLSKPRGPQAWQNLREQAEKR